MKNINLTSNSCVGCGVSLKLESILMSPNRRPEIFADKFPIINRSENLYVERKVPFQNNHPISTPLQLRYLKNIHGWMMNYGPQLSNLWMPNSVSKGFGYFTTRYQDIHLGCRYLRNHDFSGGIKNCLEPGIFSLH